MFFRLIFFELILFILLYVFLKFFMDKRYLGFYMKFLIAAVTILIIVQTAILFVLSSI